MSAGAVIRARPLSPSPRGLRRNIRRAAAKLRSAARVVIVSHERPDADAIGSTLAALFVLREAGIDAYAYNPDGVPDALRFLPGSDELSTALRGEHDTVLLLDCSTPTRVGARAPKALWQAEVVCLDHHRWQGPCPCACLVRDADAPATAELVYRLLVALDGNLSQAVAKNLFCALQSDTGSFRYASTTERAMALGRELLRADFDVWQISSALYEQQPEARVRLLGDCLSGLRRSPCGKLAFMQVTREMMCRNGATREMCDGLVNHARGIQGVEIAAIAIEEGEQDWRINFRSRGHLDVSRVAARFGGGGHVNAAGCSINAAEDEVAGLVEQALDAAFGSDT